MPQPSRRDVLSALAAWLPLSILQKASAASFLSTETPSPPLFRPIPSTLSGITWTHASGRSPAYYLPETTGAGCAFLDFDNDGWMDIFLVNSGPCDFFSPATPLRNALYRNNRDGTFTDVTVKAGIGDTGYGMGVAVGDYNRDSYPDLFITSYNRCVLYRNNGDGTFTDVTLKSGIITPGWASSALWFDYDNDGRLDLFVCRFVEFDKAANKFCGNGGTGERHYCIPRIYPPAHSWLFHNNGDGTFTDVSAATGISSSLGKAWGAVATDINNDGWMDLFVANDTVPNFLWVNRQGKFKDEGVEAGVAYSADGRARSGMGVDAADLDQDGWQDLSVTNVDQEMYSVYHNNKDGTFDDLAPANGLGEATRAMSGWGLRFFDYDNDGDVDLFIANGHPDDQIEVHSGSVTYREPLLLFHNDGGRLKNVSASAGPVFHQPLAARGLALGDFDNDGAVDVLISTNNGPPLLLQNQAAKGNHWLGIKLVGKLANMDAVGARITWKAGTLKRTRLKLGGGSFLSSHDPRMVLGIGAHTRVDQLEIHWPSPSTLVERFTDLPVDRYICIVEGNGIVS
jgi:enediyne biosynthesis protein E4